MGMAVTAAGLALAWAAAAVRPRPGEAPVPVAEAPTRAAAAQAQQPMRTVVQVSAMAAAQTTPALPEAVPQVTQMEVIQRAARPLASARQELARAGQVAQEQSERWVLARLVLARAAPVRRLAVRLVRAAPEQLALALAQSVWVVLVQWVPPVQAAQVVRVQWVPPEPALAA